MKVQERDKKLSLKEVFRQRFNERIAIAHKTAAALSREIDINQPTIHKYRHGTAMPSLEALVRIASALDCSTDYLLGLTDENGKPTTTTEGLSVIERELLMFFRERPIEEQRRLLDLLHLAVR